MGTRADFYIGKGKDAEWIGSIAWDGYRDGIDTAILQASTEDAFRSAVEQFIAKRKDGTKPSQGWPWPWNDSGTSDCSYWFFDGHCWDANYTDDERTVFVRCDIEPDEKTGEFSPEVLTGATEIEYPDMSDKKRITLGARSGVMVFHTP